MTIFFTTLLVVAILLAIASAGYILKRRNMVSEDCIPGFSKVLLYVCQPCLAIYTFQNVSYSPELMRNIGIFSLIVIAIHAVMLGGTHLVLRKRSVEPIYRIITIGTTFSNCAFFGIPVIEALLPTVSDSLVIYTTVWALVMNLVAWTVGCTIITRDLKYISVKNLFINPSMLGTLAAFALLLLGITLPEEIGSMAVTIGRMATPLSMLIMGMRLATVEFKKLFCDIRIYMTVAVKQFLMPLLVFAVMLLLKDIDVNVRKTFFIIAACPTASIVLNFAEIADAGQKEAANIVLLATILSVITLPIMMLLLPLIK